MEITQVQWSIQDYLIIHSCYVSLPHWVVDLTNVSKTSSSGGRIKPKYSPDFRFPQSQLVSMGESATPTGCIANTAQELKMTWVLNGEVTNDLHTKYGRSCSCATHTHTMLCHRSGLRNHANIHQPRGPESKKAVCSLFCDLLTSAIQYAAINRQIQGKLM